jgi:hypothetical protein
MRNISGSSSRGLSLALWLMSLPICLHGQNEGCSGMPSTPIPSFHVERATRLDALLRLAQEGHVPLAIEYVNRDLVSKPVTLGLGSTTLADAVGAILADAPGYRCGYLNGVVHITHPRPGGARNLLDFVLPQFEIPACSLEDASHELQMAVAWASHPSVRGIVGDYSAGVSGEVVGPWKLRNITVRGVLDRIIGQSGSAAWVVQVPPGHLDQLPPAGLWKIVQYSDPSIMGNAGEFFRRMIFGQDPGPSAGRGN